MTMKGLVGACLVILLFVQIDAQSSSTPSLAYHTSSVPANKSINPTSSSYHTPSTTPSTQSKPCNFGNLSVCWLHSPPYIMKNQSTGQMTGIFHDAINDLFSECCEDRRSWLNYTHQATNVSELTRCMKDKDFDIVFPVLLPNDPSRIQWLGLIRSPGIAVIKNGKRLDEEAKANVLREFLQTWTVLVLAALLSAIFGILVWALDSQSNAAEFPPGFCRGSLEGVWWAFVTMTTVGYGDKAPKFFLARVLGVVWMFIGIIVVAYLSAVMTTSLTSGTLTDYTAIGNKEFGVVNGSEGHKQGIEHGANVKVYSDLEALTMGLAKEEVEGMLLDVHTTSYSINGVWKDAPSNRFKQVKSLEYPFNIGFYLTDVFTKNVDGDRNECIVSKTKETSKTDIYDVAYKYVQSVKQKEEESWTTRLYLFRSDGPLFKISLYILSGILAALVVLGLVWELFTRQIRGTFKVDKKGFRKDTEMDVPLTRGELKAMMDNICEVEKCLGKILELKEAYDKLNDYWKDQKSEIAPLSMKWGNRAAKI